MSEYFISICIPSYNRPNELLRLLRSIDCDEKHGIQIVICEDKAPKRIEVREVIDIYKAETRYDVKYIENQINKGYDGNIRGFLSQADGVFIILMGDDDLFIPGQLDKLIGFLHQHQDLGYVLRSYRNHYRNGDTEYYRYYQDTKFFTPSEETYTELYRKSVFVSGFTFKRALVVDTETSRFDGTLLYQLYIQAEICLNYPSAYYNEPITEAYEGGEFFFGSSEKERELYTPNKHTVQGEVKFVSNFFEITKFIDEKYGTHSTETVMKDMSKYSFPMLALISENGKRDLRLYYRELKKMGFGCTKYFNLYYVALLIAGSNVCRKMIRVIKKIYGRTPRL